MSTPISGRSRRHHFIPQWFLENFCEDHVLSITRRGDGKKHQRSGTINTAAEKDLYTVVDNGRESSRIEDLMAVIDGAAQYPVKALLSQPPNALSLSEKEDLLLWVASLYVRGPRWRREQEAGDEMLDNLTGTPVTLSHTDFVLRMCQNMHAISEWLVPRRIEVARFEGAGLILADSPVTLFSEYGVASPGPQGIGTAYMIQLPLSPQVALRLVRSDVQSWPIAADLRGVLPINVHAAWFAVEEVYSAPSDEHHVEEIPEPWSSSPIINVDHAPKGIALGDGVNSAPIRRRHNRFRSRE